MFGLFKLIVPVLVPSWRFFDVIGPSPRIEYQIADGPWVPLRPKPARIALQRHVLRLFHNPHGNRSLFLTACAERVLEQPTDHGAKQILRAIAQDADPADGDAEVRFRLLLATRHTPHDVSSAVAALSSPIALAERASR